MPEPVRFRRIIFQINRLRVRGAGCSPSICGIGLLNLCLQGGVMCLSGLSLSHPSFLSLYLCDEELLLPSLHLSLSCKKTEEISNSRKLLWVFSWKNDGKKDVWSPCQYRRENTDSRRRTGAMTASQDREQEGTTLVPLFSRSFHLSLMSRCQRKGQPCQHSR